MFYSQVSGRKGCGHRIKHFPHVNVFPSFIGDTEVVTSFDLATAIFVHVNKMIFCGVESCSEKRLVVRVRPVQHDFLGLFDTQHLSLHIVQSLCVCGECSGIVHSILWVCIDSAGIAFFTFYAHLFVFRRF